MDKYRVGLFIGRFQPFHKGHLYIIRKALRNYVDSLIIGVGTANRRDSENPLSFEARKKILEEVIKNEKWAGKIKTIIPINDYLESDDIWLQKTTEMTGPFDAVLGNNEWVNGIFEKAGYPVQRLGYFKRYLYEGEKIRTLAREGKRWENRVPDYTLRFILLSFNTLT